MQLFKELLKVKNFSFSSSTGEKSLTGWNGVGSGIVLPKQIKNTILFKEDGEFKLDIAKKPTKITNEYFWEKITPNRVSLSHARFGHQHLVKLFDLIPEFDKCWTSEKAHVCVDDLYSAKLLILDHSIKLTWKIAGPKKDETISYTYSY